MTWDANETPYWSHNSSELAAALESGPNGLSSDRAAARLLSVGPNSVEDAPRLSALRLLLRQFQSPLVLILAFAAAISLALQQWVDAAIILAIVLGSSLLSFFQEYRASTAVEELKKRLALTCRVVRDGVEQTAPVGAIVPDDHILLSAGNLIPADGLVIEAQDFLVSEASMTGESFPVEKRAGIVRPDAPITERTNAVFLGASVRSGTAKVLAVSTGRRTEFGAIAARLGARQPETDFARGVRQFGYLLVRVMIVIVLFVLTVNLLLHRPVIESLLFAVALAVGLSPELLPAIISVTLSAGARAMSKRGVIVRRLDAIENLGSMDILCTDKTGTLTEGAIVLRDVLDAGSQPSDEVRRLAFLNAAFETGIENPLDEAIVTAGKDIGLTTRGAVKIDPQQKERIVRALQRTRHSVGYLGDGVNDAPALQAADVGISVETAVDIARESADIILLDRDLDVLRSGVEDGRRTFANTLKYISITTSANFGNMVSMALAAPLLPFLPLAAKQILLNNFLSDVPSIAISSDNVDADRVSHPDRMVHDFAADRTRGRPRLANPQAGFSKQPEPVVVVVDACGGRRDLRHPLPWGDELGVRLRAALGD